MKLQRILVPALCAVVLAGCDGGNAQTTSPSPVTSTTLAAPNPATNPAVVAASNRATSAVVGVDPKPFKAPAELPAPVQEVVRLAQTTLGENVLLSYVSNVSEPFALSADQVIYLNDLGISDPVVSALLKRSNELKGNPAAAGNGGAATTANATAPVAVAPAAAAQTVRIEVANAPATPPAAPAPASSAPAGASTYADVPGGAPNNGAVVYGQPQPAAPTVQAGPAAPAGTPVMAQQPGGTVINYNQFYESLSPYGTWVDVPSYGYVWRPTVAVIDTGWHPYYQNGSWAWSDYGWYWNSGYSWGWAPFHYGRWHRHNSFGWVWQPGCDWGPAWVNWSYTGSHCAWAPLPPECRWSSGVGFTWWNGGLSASIGFGLGYNSWVGVGWNNFCEPRVWRHGVPRTRVTEIVNQGTTQVVGNRNQVVNINGNNNTVVINNGAPFDKARNASRAEIQKVAIADVASPGATGPTGGRAPGASANRPVIAAYRPHLSAPAASQPTAPPASVLSRQREEERKTAAAPSNVAQRPNFGQLPPTALGGGRVEAPGRSDLGGRPAANPGIIAPAAGAVRPAASAGNTAPPTASRGTAAPASSSAAGQPMIGPAPRPGETFANPNSRPPSVAARPYTPSTSQPGQAPNRDINGNAEISKRPTAAPGAPARTESTPTQAPALSPGYRPNPLTSPAARPSGRPAPSASTAVIQDNSRIQNPSTSSRSEVRKFDDVPGAAYNPPQYQSRSAPQYGAAPGRQAPAAPAPAATYSAPPAATYTPANRPSASAPAYSAPSARQGSEYSSPSARSAPAPTYSAPSRNYSAPAPSYSAPAARPAPSQAASPAPAPARSAPAPSYSAPSRPSSEGSGSGRGSKDK